MVRRWFLPALVVLPACRSVATVPVTGTLPASSSRTAALDVVLVAKRPDGGPLPIYLKLDRTQETPALRWLGP